MAILPSFASNPCSITELIFREGSSCILKFKYRIDAGLGLYLCRAIIETCHGSVEAER